jgi:hypothetical protein
MLSEPRSLERQAPWFYPLYRKRKACRKDKDALGSRGWHHPCVGGMARRGSG